MYIHVDDPLQAAIIYIPRRSVSRLQPRVRPRCQAGTAWGCFQSFICRPYLQFYFGFRRKPTRCCCTRAVFFTSSLRRLSLTMPGMKQELHCKEYVKLVRSIPVFPNNGIIALLLITPPPPGPSGRCRDARVYVPTDYGPGMKMITPPLPPPVLQKIKCSTIYKFPVLALRRRPPPPMKSVLLSVYSLRCSVSK